MRNVGGKNPRRQKEKRVEKPRKRRLEEAENDLKRIGVRVC